jgi:hypothetical protein
MNWMFKHNRIVLALIGVNRPYTNSVGCYILHYISVLCLLCAALREQQYNSTYCPYAQYSTELNALAMHQWTFECLSRLVQTAWFFLRPSKYSLIIPDIWRHHVTQPIPFRYHPAALHTDQYRRLHNAVMSKCPQIQSSAHQSCALTMHANGTSRWTQVSVRKVWSAEGHSKRDILHIARRLSKLNLWHHEINFVRVFVPTTLAQMYKFRWCQHNNISSE